MTMHSKLYDNLRNTIKSFTEGLASSISLGNTVIYDVSVNNKNEDYIKIQLTLRTIDSTMIKLIKDLENIEK